MKQSRSNTKAYTTKDGSTIRELLHPNLHPVMHQSLAEATLSPGQITDRHFHKNTEEIYFILEGEGEMHLGTESFLVNAGDSILISPKNEHCIKNIGNNELRFLCCCAPAYDHNDTYLINEN